MAWHELSKAVYSTRELRPYFTSAVGNGKRINAVTSSGTGYSFCFNPDGQTRTRQRPRHGLFYERPGFYVFADRPEKAKESKDSQRSYEGFIGINEWGQFLFVNPRESEGNRVTSRFTVAFVL